MPIRDIALTLTVVGLLPACLVRPWIGILVWCWFGFMNPHKLTWGFASQIPFSMMVAAPTLVGFLFSKDRKPFIWNTATLALVALWGWFTITSVFALYPVDAWWQWNRVSKILLMVVVSVSLFQDRGKLRLLLLVMAGSVGFYGLKGGLFALRNGGQFMVQGAPGDTFISTNNALALALNMCLPIFLGLARDEPRRSLRILLYASFFLSIISVLFTYSRGGFLGLLIVLAMLFLNRRNVILAVLAAVIIVVGALYFAPQRWTTRMETIQHYEEDTSARQRLVAWRVGAMLASDYPLFGGGFLAFNQGTFDRYAPDYPGGGHGDAHSLYFNLLGEHGYVGLGLFTLMVGFLLVRLAKLRKVGVKNPQFAWVSNYAHMLQSSIVGYLVTGAFLSVAYFDLAYQLFVIAAILDRLAAEEATATAPLALTVPLPAIARVVRVGPRA